jgi:murein DD-endopeptidase MepM/ murein hydrolase activator NlpD
MANKISFIVMGGSGRTVKQVHCSRCKFFSIVASIVVAALALGYGLYDYIRIQHLLGTKMGVEYELNQQSQEVQLQRRQIQKFAEEINDLKDRLLELNRFEERIRIIANIERKDNNEGLFGVGGSTPEDLNANIDLRQKHTHLIKGIHRQVAQLDNATLNQKETFSSLLQTLEQQKNLLSHTPAIWPVHGWISSRFGYRQSPFTGKREFHKGLDIANRHGTPIIATADGVVSFVGEKGSLGLTVVIDHGHGITTRYAHLEQIVKKKSERVKRGETIALLGNSGRSTGPHLHYEVRLNGVQVNPTKYILN